MMTFPGRKLFLVFPLPQQQGKHLAVLASKRSFVTYLLSVSNEALFRILKMYI